MTHLIRYAFILIMFLFAFLFWELSKWFTKYSSFCNCVFSMFAMVIGLVMFGAFVFTTVEFALWVFALTF